MSPPRPRPASLLPLPEIPEDIAECPPAQRIELGLQLHAAGLSLYRAGQIAHVDSGVLSRNARKEPQDRAEQRRKNLQGLAVLAEQIATESGRQTLEALREGAIPTKQLPIVYGISMDKRVGLERALGPSDQGDALGQLADRIQEAVREGASFRLEVSGRERAEPAREPEREVRAVEGDGW